MTDNPSNKVETGSLKSGIAYGMSALGVIPLRYNEPRFPSLRRRTMNEIPEQRLLKIGNGIVPATFALSTFSTLGKPAQSHGNHRVLSMGVNLGRNNGHLYRLHGAPREIQCTGTVYSNSMEALLSWVASIGENQRVAGLTEFADGGAVPVTVDINDSFSWTDPVASDESATLLERLFAVEVTYTINTIAARVSSQPLFKAAIIRSQLGNEPTEELVEIPAIDPDDWP